MFYTLGKPKSKHFPAQEREGRASRLKLAFLLPQAASITAEKWEVGGLAWRCQPASLPPNNICITKRHDDLFSHGKLSPCGDFPRKRQNN